jgi:hypothetical protein
MQTDKDKFSVLFKGRNNNLRTNKNENKWDSIIKLRKYLLPLYDDLKGGEQFQSTTEYDCKTCIKWQKKLRGDSLQEQIPEKASLETIEITIWEEK